MRPSAQGLVGGSVAQLGAACPVSSTATQQVLLEHPLQLCPQWVLPKECTVLCGRQLCKLINS